MCYVNIALFTVSWWHTDILVVLLGHAVPLEQTQFSLTHIAILPGVAVSINIPKSIRRE